MAFVGADRFLQASPLSVGEVLDPAPEDGADSVQRVALAAAVAVDLLLHPAADLVDCGGAELDHVERIEHRGGVLELVVDRILVAVERVQRRDLHPVAEGLAALFEPVAG